MFTKLPVRPSSSGAEESSRGEMNFSENGTGLPPTVAAGPAPLTMT